MKIVNILGGLGNQMFQYALALALREKHPEEIIRIDTSAFNGYPLHNGYELKRIFNVNIPDATLKEQMTVFYPLRNYRMWQMGRRFLPKKKTVIVESNNMRYTSEILELRTSGYYLGYWQTEKYFSDIRSKVLDSFSFPQISDRVNHNLITDLYGKITVGVHIRRGDYLKIENAQGICNLNYYKKAILCMLERVRPDVFLIFSDDIDWCRANLSESFGKIQTIYVDWNKGKESYRDMQLMSLCNHNIIANSSFSWWGAWLNRNPEKIVIAPTRWMNNGGWVDIIPNDWLKIITSSK